MKELLVVIDYQNDFVNGALGFEGAEKLDGPIVEKYGNTAGGAPTSYSPGTPIAKTTLKLRRAAGFPWSTA